MTLEKLSKGELIHRMSRTPLELDAQRHGRSGGASLDGHPCPFCRRALLACSVGPCDVLGQCVENVVRNDCPECGETVLAEGEFLRVRG